MRDDMEPHDTVAVPDDGRPPLGAYGELARLEDALQRLQRPVEAHGDALVRQLLQVTTDTVTLAQGLLQGWDASQTAREDRLGTWRDHIQALETTGRAMEIQAQMLQRELRHLHRESWWSFLTGVGVTGLLALTVWLLTLAPHPVPRWQALPPPLLVPESVRPSEEPPSAAPDAPLTPGTHDAPIRDGP